jgi:cytochrome oxidase Cu insertion factor (SCO1/SenC/PrrC family)
VQKPDFRLIVPALACLVVGGLGGIGTALVTKPSAEVEPARFDVPRRPPPHFRLRDESGTWRTPASAGGEVLIVTFIYTRCRDLCPRQAAEIKEAVLAPGGGVQVYAITVDPEHDTPERAQAWLKRMGVIGGPVHILLGSRHALEPVWSRFGIVPLERSPREQGESETAEQYEQYLEEYREHGGEEAREETLEHRPAPAAAHDEYPPVGDGTYRGRSRHVGGLDYEHSAYALLIDERGRQRVGFPYERITADGLLADLQALKAES